VCVNAEFVTFFCRQTVRAALFYRFYGQNAHFLRPERAKSRKKRKKKRKFHKKLDKRDLFVYNIGCHCIKAKCSHGCPLP
jgi:thermostable 8-oxoguanine DNA glycosylase